VINWQDFASWVGVSYWLLAALMIPAGGVAAVAGGSLIARLIPFAVTFAVPVLALRRLRGRARELHSAER
jgi:hypothetical protein